MTENDDPFYLLNFHDAKNWGHPWHPEGDTGHLAQCRSVDSRNTKSIGFVEGHTKHIFCNLAESRNCDFWNGNAWFEVDNRKNTPVSDLDAMGWGNGRIKSMVCWMSSIPAESGNPTLNTTDNDETPTPVPRAIEVPKSEATEPPVTIRPTPELPRKLVSHPIIA